MTPTDNDVAVKVWEENRRLAREEQYNFCNSPRIWHNFYITVGLLIAILSYVEWVHLGPLTFSGDGMAGAMVAGCDDDPYPGCRQTVYHYRKAEMGPQQSGQECRFDERRLASDSNSDSDRQPGSC